MTTTRNKQHGMLCGRHQVLVKPHAPVRVHVSSWLEGCLRPHATHSCPRPGYGLRCVCSGLAEAFSFVRWVHEAVILWVCQWLGRIVIDASDAGTIHECQLLKISGTGGAGEIRRRTVSRLLLTILPGGFGWHCLGWQQQHYRQLELVEARCRMPKTRSRCCSMAYRYDLRGTIC